MPPKTKESPAADAAAVEVLDPSTEVTVEFGDHFYQFKRKRLRATQFLLPMQKGFNETAIEWLLGPAKFAQFLNRNLDEDGCTSNEVFFDFVEAIGKELGTGNS